MAWQRYNRTSNVFEVSDDNGASWIPLVIAAGGLPANVAYRNINNSFVAQTLGSYSSVNGVNGCIILNDTSAGVDQKYWRIVNYSNGLLYFDAMTDNGAAYISQPLQIIRSPPGIQADSINTGPLTCSTMSSGAVNCSSIADSGGAAIGSNVTINGKITTQSFNGPDLGGGGVLCHYLEASPAHIRAAAGVYDYARAVPIGGWSNVASNPARYAGFSVANIYGDKYILFGNTCIYCWYYTGTSQAVASFLSLASPIGGYFAGGYSSGSCGYITDGNGVRITASWICPTGDTHLRIYKDNGAAWVAGGSFTLSGTAIFQF